MYFPQNLPPSSELWQLPNVIVSPHDSQTCVDNDARVQKIFIDNMTRFLHDESSKTKSGQTRPND